ncbi:Cytochrome bo(3) ubiquinol oxidase subunit 1 [Photobacterium piscicola]|uniref:Cytochrome bo(3) ubiquinol oxidase subunit 1 n=1 Tax=Photobacterium piscicola TaxID=1378299 RepID=A0A1T5HW97_9GAMM|nr:Cytochrome bo(3) ubiquinol oxidase subunit 1 [Photobacterium piscicola]
MAYKGDVYAEADPIFGKLNWDVIPFSDPVVFPVMMAVVLGGLGLLSLITYQKKWHYLWSEWFTSVDHKKIGIMYIIVSMVMLVRGFSDAILMRSQQAASTIDASYLPPEHYDQVFTAHGVIMIFFVAMPFVVGLMNIIVPLQIGARDVAFPFLNSLSFWLFVVGVILINLSLFVGEFAATGWLAYPPLSGMDANPWVGVDYWLWSLQISGIGTLLTGINFVVTIIRMRAPGMKMMQMPVFTWTSLCANALIVLAFPILTVTLTLLTLDRYVGTHFFTTDMGGNQMMYVNLIWAWGHPEVYILVLPAFGIFSEITATFSRKRLFGYTSLVWATMVIMVLSFIVWLHHFFTMGAGASVNAFFGIATMIISIPTGVKIFNWLFTMYKGRVEFSASMWWTIAFLITFTIGGMTGVMLAIPAANFVLHNSLFVIAHFHNVIIGGALFGYFAGLTYWFPKATGFTLDERLGKISCALWTVGFFVAFMPVYVLGFNGMTRRLNVADNPEWAPYLWVAAFGVCIVAAGIAVQFYQIFVSIRDRKQNLDLTGDPWNGRTLEWATSSPPPFYNFALLPKIHDRDEHHYAKEHGLAYQKPERYKRIHMPKNTWAGVVISMFSLMFGFAFIWHIWWMVIAGTIGMIASWIVYSFQRSKDYYVEVSEVEAIERKHLAKARGEKTAEHKDGKDDDDFDPSDLKPADYIA